MSGATPAAGPDKERLDPELIRLAVILLVGVVMVAFDTTIVNVAIAEIAQGLHTTVSTAQWTISGYVLALGVVVPVAGWASERFGAKQVWMGALALFMVGSVLSSVASDIDALIAFRVLQGVGLGAVTIPVMAAAYLGLRPDQVPHASSVTRIAQQVGGAFGTAVLAMILSTQLHIHQAAGLAGQATAFGNTFWWSLGFTAVAIVPALALPHQRTGPIHHEPEQHPIPSHPQE